MSNELVTKIEASPEVFSPNLPVTRGMLENMQLQRDLLREFVSSQLTKDVDYGIVPGTKKPSLLKPGAEKLRGLFGLNVKLDCTHRDLDKVNNYASFSYKAQVFRGDNLISECEGSTNSQEQKYKERKVWRYDEKVKKKVEIKEITPVFDILNTLQKMAQKRAFVGAVILAVGASDFFSQDIDEPEDAKNIGVAPKVEPGPSSIPKVVNVTSKPVENNQSNAAGWYEAIVSFDEKDAAKEHGFRWSSEKKKWLKELTSDEVMNGFPFEIRGA